MSQNGSASKRDTLDAYSSLVRLEVRTLTARLADISVEIASFAENFGAVLLEVEDMTQRVDSLQTGIDYCRAELTGVKALVASLEQRLQEVQDLVGGRKQGQ